jgi:hypothetical protein
MSRNIISVLMYHRHKLLDLIYIFPFLITTVFRRTRLTTMCEVQNSTHKVISLPRQIYNLGGGGGSVVNFCSKHLPLHNLSNNAMNTCIIDRKSTSEMIIKIAGYK